MKPRLCPDNALAPPTYSRHPVQRALLSCAVAGGLFLVFPGCTTPSSSKGSSGETESPDSPARLSLGATQAEANEGRTASFVLENTPDMVLHATLRDATYEGKMLQIQGTDPQGTVVWSYPHVQRGTSFDAVLPVFGSAAARKHVTGTYSFKVLAPDKTVIATGSAAFTSSRGSAGDAGGAFYRVSSPGDAVVAASKE